VLAGCLDGSNDVPESNDETSDDSNRDDEPEGNDETGNPDDSPDSSDRSADLPDEGYPGNCPEYRPDRVICYQAIVENEVDSETLPGILEPSTESFGSGGAVEFVLSNQSEGTLSINPYGWRLDKQVNGEWYKIAPWAVPFPAALIPPGGSYTWSVQVDNSEVEAGELVSGTTGEGDLTFAGLGSGRYAFCASGGFEEYEDDFAFTATVEYEGDSLDLTTTNLIGETGFEGETLVAEPADSRPVNHAYVLERVEGSDGKRVITEQLLRNPHRRDAVALAEKYEADRVRLDGYSADHSLRDPLGTFQYQGQGYELTKQGEN
jgi:hypothetical protein